MSKHDHLIETLISFWILREEERHRAEAHPQPDHLCHYSGPDRVAHVHHEETPARDR